DPQRRAVLIAEWSPRLGVACAWTCAWRSDPDVLDRATLEHPGEMDLPEVLAGRAVGEKRLPFGLPTPIELAVQPQLSVQLCARRMRARCVGEGVFDTHHRMCLVDGKHRHRGGPGVREPGL